MLESLRVLVFTVRIFDLKEDLRLGGVGRADVEAGISVVNPGLSVAEAHSKCHRLAGVDSGFGWGTADGTRIRTYRYAAT